MCVDPARLADGLVGSAPRMEVRAGHSVAVLDHDGAVTRGAHELADCCLVVPGRQRPERSAERLCSERESSSAGNRLWMSEPGMTALRG